MFLTFQRETLWLCYVDFSSNFPGVTIGSPVHSVDFLDDIDSILGTRFAARTVQDCKHPAGI